MKQEEGYWQDFLQEFHHNQRQAESSQTAPAAFFARVSSWFSEVSPSRWAYGAGIAYATAAAIFLLAPRSAEVSPGSPATQIKHQVVPAPEMEQLEQLDLDPSSEGIAGEQRF
ncbi:MAG: hypothetical protein ACSHX7_01150 [Luteolibacter sp.]